MTHWHQACFFLALSAAAVGCGHRGPPRPPLPKVPRSPSDVTWIQRGDRLEISARVDLRDLEGRPLRPPVSLVLLVFPAPTPQLASGWSSPSRDREFLRIAQARPFPPLKAPGDQPSRPRKLRETADFTTFGAAEAYVLALSLEDARGRSIPSTRRVFIPASPALPPPDELRVLPEEEGVRVSWVWPKDARIRVMRLFRRIEGKGEEWQCWKEAERDVTEVFDESVRYGQELSYAAASAIVQGDVPVESLLVKTPALKYRDLFPPAPAQDLEAVAESGRVRVLWFPGGSPDERLARIERQEEGSTQWREVGQVLVPDTDFEDAATEQGHRYRYRVTTVDQAGNEAPPAGPTRWVSPRPPRSTPGKKRTSRSPLGRRLAARAKPLPLSFLGGSEP